MNWYKWLEWFKLFYRFLDGLMIDSTDSFRYIAGVVCKIFRANPSAGRSTRQGCPHGQCSLPLGDGWRCQWWRPAHCRRRWIFASIHSSILSRFTDCHTKRNSIWNFMEVKNFSSLNESSILLYSGFKVELLNGRIAR